MSFIQYIRCLLPRDSLEDRQDFSLYLLSQSAGAVVLDSVVMYITCKGVGLDLSHYIQAFAYQCEYAYLPEVNAFLILTFMFLNLGYSLPFRGRIDHQSG